MCVNFLAPDQFLEGSISRCSFKYLRSVLLLIPIITQTSSEVNMKIMINKRFIKSVLLKFDFVIDGI